jgi:hypothetical protein
VDFGELIWSLSIGNALLWKRFPFPFCHVRTSGGTISEEKTLTRHQICWYIGLSSLQKWEHYLFFLNDLIWGIGYISLNGLRQRTPVWSCPVQVRIPVSYFLAICLGGLFLFHSTSIPYCLILPSSSGCFEYWAAPKVQHKWANFHYLFMVHKDSFPPFSLPFASHFTF